MDNPLKENLLSLKYNRAEDYLGGPYGRPVVIHRAMGKSLEDVLKENPAISEDGKIDQSAMTEFGIRSFPLRDGLKTVVMDRDGNYDVFITKGEDQEVIATFSSCDLSISTYHMYRGYGKYLTKLKLLLNGGLDTWDHDKAGYSSGGAECIVKACEELADRFQRRQNNRQLLATVSPERVEELARFVELSTGKPLKEVNMRWDTQTDRIIVEPAKGEFTDPLALKFVDDGASPKAALHESYLPAPEDMTELSCFRDDVVFNSKYLVDVDPNGPLGGAAKNGRGDLLMKRILDLDALPVQDLKAKGTLHHETDYFFFLEFRVTDWAELGKRAKACYEAAWMDDSWRPKTVHEAACEVSLASSEKCSPCDDGFQIIDDFDLGPEIPFEEETPAPPTP